MSEAKYKFAFYLGCIAPNRYPGCESASIKGLKKLGIDWSPSRAQAAARHRVHSVRLT